MGLCNKWKTGQQAIILCCVGIQSIHYRTSQKLISARQAPFDILFTQEVCLGINFVHLWMGNLKLSSQLENRKVFSREIYDWVKDSFMACSCSKLWHKINVQKQSTGAFLFQCFWRASLVFQKALCSHNYSFVQHIAIHNNPFIISISGLSPVQKQCSSTFAWLLTRHAWEISLMHYRSTNHFTIFGCQTNQKK